MSLKTALINLAGSVGKCQENARSLKQCLELGLTEVAKSTIDGGLDVEIWTNPDTTQDFEAGSVTATVTGSFSAYIIIYGNKSGGIEDHMVTLDNVACSLYVTRLSTDGKIYVFTRNATITTSEGTCTATFTDCKTAAVSAVGTSFTTSAHNNNKIPYAIYGIR